MAKQGEGIVQFVKFGVVGVLNTAVDWIVYYIVAGYIITAVSAKPTAKAISFLVAVLNSYLWNTIWTFKKEYKQSTQKSDSAKSAIFVKFVIVSLIGWVVNYFVFKYVLDNFSFNDLVLLGKTVSAQDLYPLIAASAAAVIWNFFANKLWTYRNHTNS